MSLPPGWYKDPAEPTTQRWWDGEGWVGEPLPADATPPPGPPAPAPTGPAPREPRVPAVPGLPGATEAPPPPAEIPPTTPTRPHGRPGFGVPPGGPPPPSGKRRPAPATQPPPLPPGLQLATLGARALARLVDIGVVLLLNVLVNGWFVYLYWQEVSPTVREAWRRSLTGEDLSDLPQVSGQAGTLQIVILLLVAALWFAYEVPAVANTGQTPGKRLLRIRVVRLEDGQQLGIGRSIRRWNTMGVPTLLWLCFGCGFLLQLIDVLFALFDRPLRQALHDKSAFTVVVSVPTGPGKESSDEPTDPS